MHLLQTLLDVHVLFVSPNCDFLIVMNSLCYIGSIFGSVGIVDFLRCQTNQPLAHHRLVHRPVCGVPRLIVDVYAFKVLCHVDMYVFLICDFPEICL